MKRLPNWKGEQVELAESAGGVLAFVDPLEGLVRGGVNPWPAPEIAQKLHKSRQQRAFRDENLEGATRILGFYSDLQSVHSEDALTWSVFGPVAHTSARRRCDFIRAVISLISDDLPNPEEAGISLWRRLPHPDTLVSGGPEIDFLIQTPEVVVLGEAKWRSGVGTRQGKDGNKDQIQIRTELLTKYGQKLFPGVPNFALLGVSIEGHILTPKEQPLGGGRLILKDVTWLDLCGVSPHPAESELRSYYDWKLKHSKS